MLRSPGSSRRARPMIPEEAVLKMQLLGVETAWDPGSSSFTIMSRTHSTGSFILLRTVTAFDMTVEEWDRVLGSVADDMVKARLPVGHLATSPVETFKVDAASVIDTENFK